ncbi:MFS transporter [Neolentinus lepideus HHB14362 ss-1]|uniref:MFS transporter n=1 Tax=Neolentinus lepideus HHB14362 ss-1 TaxID=1314782 RepID=A0A165S0Z5_9AGAM|nr:MFS transporter [Neolentinus lepideus HHB14362 ss-1]
MASSPEVEHSQTREATLTKKVLWKFDSHILPPLALVWLANFLDRSNAGNARIVGLESDIHLVGNQFNIALTVFYATYVAVELPSNWIIKKVGPTRWLPFLVCAFGTVTTLSGLIQNFAGLTAIRVVLGMCEGGLLPGMVLYLSTIYRRHELQLRISVFYAAVSLSGAFGGLLATAIIKMNGVGGLAGWRWIFILEGLGSVIAGLICAAVLPVNIETARFLTEEERAFALNRFYQSNVIMHTTEPTDLPDIPADPEKTDQGDKAEPEKVQVTVASAYQAEEHFEWREVVRGLTEIQAWFTGLAFLGLNVGFYSFSLFLPTIVTGLGFEGASAQLHTVPPYVPAVVLTIFVAFLSDKLRWRGPFILICLPVAMIGKCFQLTGWWCIDIFTGYIIAIAAKTNEARYVAVFLIAAGIYPSAPCILSILPNNCGGHYKRATVTALQLAIANTGGFIATFAYTSDEAPKYIRGHSIALAFTIFAWLLIAFNITYCIYENRARRRGQRDDNIRQYRELVQSDRTKAPIGDRHPHFLFTL